MRFDNALWKKALRAWPLRRRASAQMPIISSIPLIQKMGIACMYGGSIGIVTFLTQMNLLQLSPFKFWPDACNLPVHRAKNLC